MTDTQTFVNLMHRAEKCKSNKERQVILAQVHKLARANSILEAM